MISKTAIIILGIVSSTFAAPISGPASGLIYNNHSSQKKRGLDGEVIIVKKSIKQKVFKRQSASPSATYYYSTSVASKTSPATIVISVPSKVSTSVSPVSSTLSLSSGSMLSSGVVTLATPFSSGSAIAMSSIGPISSAPSASLAASSAAPSNIARSML